ncbi:MAG: sulfatase-like hydrolase/transferase [Acidobacteriota bacterium]
MIGRVWALLACLTCATACARPPAPPAPATARDVVLITIDTLRADHVGAYGHAAARTSTLDGLARDGARFARAWATAPITLPSHASLLTGRYPPAHGARHNGIAVDAAVPTLAARLKEAGFVTGAFVSAFPLDQRLGLARGFDVYDDVLPRGADGRPLNERSGDDTVTRALGWLRQQGGARVFLWVHLFEPHAPYGPPGAGGAATTRYDDDIAVADREAGRLLAALGERASRALVVATADHGEAFGEHGEIGHSIFVYDTTLRVPLVMRGPGVPAGLVVPDDVSLVDLAPTIAALTGVAAFDADGQSLAGVLAGHALAPRALYAESFAPYFDFGWAALRAVREGGVKYIAAPRPELFDLDADPGESANRAALDPRAAARLDARAAAWSAAVPEAAPAASAEATARLRSLGYLSGAGTGPTSTRDGRADPKDKIDIASRIAMVTSGEVQGEARVAALRAILRDDPGNPQAHLRLGFAELERQQCGAAEPHLRAALAAGVPSADAGLGLAQCRGARGDLKGAAEALAAARRAEPGNPVVSANLGLVALQQGHWSDAIPLLREALAADPLLLEARFALARALALSGDRAGAILETERLLGELPPTAPQRLEVQRLLAALQ